MDELSNFNQIVGFFMPDLTYNGSYFRYEIQEIDEDNAKQYIADGIDEDDLEDMEFCDEYEQGITGDIILQVDGSEVATFDIESFEVTSVEPQPDYWHILKLEHGRRGYVCGPLEIQDDFNKDAVEFATYLKKVGERAYRYAWASYDEKDVESTDERIDDVEYFVVSPKGKIHDLEIN